MRVAPIRFTADAAGMRRFCEALGLHAEVVADSGGWVGLTASVTRTASRSRSTRR
jgi:hypothetical protein